MTAPSVPLRTTATTKPKPNALTAADVGLTHGELALAVERLGRTPNDLELGMLGAMWSEHCAYKHSRPLLALLPTHGHGVLAGPGANAGAVDLGGGLACVFKVESHNHPSAVEPFQGAATGVGGIIRDVFAMGARPAALLNALFFGDPARPRTRYLAGGVVGGISFYGNCVGIPDVGGHVSFLPDFDDNPLVNAMCVGIGRSDRLIGADTAVPGQSVYLVGADTGRDGIAGASLLASFELGDKSDEKRPSVQVGDPFLEKLLMEACLELADHGHLSAMQDLGAAGLTCAASELAAKSGAGIEVDVRAVPRRAAGMTPYEVMLSESQERMLVVPRRGHEKNVERICARWGLHCSRVGTVLDEDIVRVRDGEAIAAEMSAKLLAEGAPTYALDAENDRRTAAARERSPFAELPPRERLLALHSSPQLASRERIWRRYDQMVGTDTVIGPGADAAVLRIKGRPDGIAVSLDANPELARIDPYAAAAATVLEAVRNLVCVGARPLALTDCVNLGNPERAHGAWQLRRTIEGLAAASRALGVPIVSGNVSLYNASSGRDIVPTLVVGAVGRLDDVSRAIRPGIGAEGDALIVLGGQDDLAAQRALHELILAAHERHLVAAAHDVGEGGVAIAVAEMAIAGGRGASLALAEDPFASEPARIIVATPEPEALLDLARSAGVPCRHVGAVGGEHVRVLGALEVRLDECRAAHGNGLATALGLP